ncbi:MAG TPA: 30S ribosomal protein S8 [Myxococcota bacterium]|nr:30S ribosomal protein S8 [Myxococcota bacterium]
MTMTDPIADLLTRIRNAQQAGHEALKVTCSKEKVAIVKILKDEGFITDFAVVADKPRDSIEVKLRYSRENAGAIHGIRRESTPGRRVYVTAKQIPQVRSGLGLAIVSTSKGVLAGHVARAENVGGELICTVW